MPHQLLRVVMNNRISFLMFATAISCLSFGCSQTNSSLLSQTSEAAQNNQNQGVEGHQSPDHKWLHYADPKADANLAIEKQDFKLLAFAGRATSFPGLKEELSALSVLRQQCGYRLLANTSDALRSENQLTQRKKLYQYAATYNVLVAGACQKKLK
jgi:hypothetical protein